MIGPNSPEAWLAHHLPRQRANATPKHPATPYDTIIQRTLPIMLVVAAYVVATMWYREDEQNLLSTADLIGYPLLLFATLGGAVLLLLRPHSIRTIVVAVLILYILHLLAVYYQEMWPRITGGAGSEYELTIMALWFPLGYVGSFVFFSPRRAIITSLAIYLALALPQLAILATDTTPTAHLMADAILMSQPVYIITLWGVAQLKQQAADTRQVVRPMGQRPNIDALTGITSRHAMTRVLEAVIESHHNGDRPVSLTLLDVDHFKRINGTFGHEVGDEVLAGLARALYGQLGSCDLLARWADEEFMLLQLDHDADQARQFAEQLRSRVEYMSHPQAGCITISLGVTELIPGDDIHALIHRADLALYRAKESGRNRAVLMQAGNEGPAPTSRTT